MKILKKILLTLVCYLALIQGGYAQKDEFIGDVEFKKVTMQDAVRILSELSGRNVIVTQDAANKSVSMFIRNATLVEAIDSMCRITGLWYRKDSDTNVYIVMTAAQFKEDVLVYRNEVNRIFTLQHQNVVSAANAIQTLYGSRVDLEAPVNDRGYKFDGDLAKLTENANRRTTRNRRNTNNKKGVNNRPVSEKDKSLQKLTGELSSNTLSQIGDSTIVDETEIAGYTQAAPIRVTYNRLHNLLLVRSSDEKAINDIENLIKQIDKPAKQVLLQMKIMRVSLGEDEASVFDFQYTNDSVSGPNSGLITNPLQGAGVSGKTFGLGMDREGLQTGSLLFQLATDNWLAKLAFLESESRTKTISTPIVMASNNKEAEIFIGEERPFVENISSNGGTITADGIITPRVLTTEITKQDVGTKLRIWPRINSDSTVTLDIEQDISRLNEDAATIPVATGGGALEEYDIDTVTTTNLKLTAIARHGQTIAVGGLVEEADSDTSRRVPGTSDIPILGDLFSSDTKEKTKSELVILIKPFIYDSADSSRVKAEELKSLVNMNESKNIIEKEIGNSYVNNRSDLKVDRDIQDIAQDLRNVMLDPNSFKAETAVDWQYKNFIITSAGSTLLNGYYYTKVVVNNDRRIPVEVDEASLGDYWEGIAWLPKPGENMSKMDGLDRRTAILITKTPIENIVKQQGLNMRYVLSGANR